MKSQEMLGGIKDMGWDLFTSCECPHTYIKACTSKVNCLMVVFYKLSFCLLISNCNKCTALKLEPNMSFMSKGLERSVPT